MIIAFIILAVIALVFLFIYNARVSKKSAKRRAAENVRTAGENTPAEPVVGTPPAASLEGAQAEEPARPRPAAPSELESDRAYREALRQFAGSVPAKEPDPAPPVPEPDHSSDNAYREALRAMARREKDKE